MKLENFMTVRKGYVPRGSNAVTGNQERAKGDKTPGEIPGRNDFGQNGRYISILKKENTMHNYHEVPPEILTQGRFCCWRLEERAGRKTKVPYNPNTGQPAKSNDPGTFASFEIAYRAQGYDGIGLGIFNGLCAIDLDDCVTDSGYFTEPAATIVEIMHTYTEFSPSKKGLHLYFFAKDFCYDSQRYYTMNHKAGVEVYVAGATSKYVTLTGDICQWFEFGDRSEELKEVLERFMIRPCNESSRPNGVTTFAGTTNALAGRPAAARNAINAIKSTASTLDDAALLEKARSSKNGERFWKLYSGDTGAFQSASEADMALCSHLAFWTGRDASQMDRLFRASGLMREKWDRPQSGSTYGAITIRNAIQKCTQIYEPKAEVEPVFLPVIPLTPAIGELPNFPVAALPPIVADYVNAVSENSQTAPGMAAVIGLGVLATALQGKFRVQGMPGYYEPLNLYTLVIAAPGERKSGVIRDMTRVLYDYEMQYNADHAGEIRTSARKRETLQRQISGLKKKLEAKENREMELELQQLEDELEAMPVEQSRRFFADDCSSEALTNLLANNGGTLSVISSEGGIFDILAGRYNSSANLDTWLKAHCGDPISVDRMSRDAEYIPHPCLTAILTVQPNVLDCIMANTTMVGRGLLARFLYSFPTSRIGSRTFRTPGIPSEVREKYRNLIFRLMALPTGEEPETLVLSEKAEEIIAGYFEEHERFMVEDGQIFPDWAAKYIGAVLRIAGLLHAADMAPGEKEISAETVGRAIEIGTYFLAHAMHAYSTMGADVNIAKAKFVWAKIRKMQSMDIKRSQLFQNCRGKYFSKTEELFSILELLEEYGYLKIVRPEYQGTGRPADVHILVNPAAVS